MKDDKIGVIKTTGKKGGLTKIIYNNDVYAIVYKGQPYISTNYGFYRLSKTNDDFTFIGRASTLTNSSGSDVMNHLSFGIVGALLEPRQSAVYRMKLDHLTGQFIILEEVKK